MEDLTFMQYAAVMGMNTDLTLTGNDFSNASTAFFIAYLVAEVPNSRFIAYLKRIIGLNWYGLLGYFLQKVHIGKWLGLNVVAWGVVTACTAATMNYQTLLVARIFLGVFEASISPSLMLIGSQWYNRSEQATRFSLWYCGLGIAQISGGIVSFAFQHIGPGGLAGWRVMFIALGFVTVIIGTITALILPDSPISAKFLSKAEKAALLNHVSENRTGIESRRFKPSQEMELLLDTQIWLMAFITILVSGLVDAMFLRLTIF
jgi:MFS family permease